ncbi:hypothetical protein KAF25_002499 [Fusarium avenaceum]|uniref:Protein kinase domain-containing protein n=1 Tax=Fusarium avenaceum TaxID=40199 RepID=A0A9P7KVX4_9HYPO|nr:hypothetical protein KAF25_002499 [Fusarium avenaceum]
MADDEIAETFKTTIGADLQAPYSHVHVLMIAWADNDLEGVDKEIEDLRAIFEKEYNYNSVTFFPIPIRGSPWMRLNVEISSFIEEKSSLLNSLAIIYYAGHCGPDAHGNAEWAAFEQGGPTIPWHVTQQLLFSAPGDVLLILDCCQASLITRGTKDGHGRFELIAASAKGAKTPAPGRKSFTRGLIRLLQEHVTAGVSSETLASYLREDPKITETPVFHDFARKSPTKITLQRLFPTEAKGEFTQKPSGYLLFRAALSDDVTGLQIANWLKTAPPKNVTAVSIEAIVSRARSMQGVLKDGAFPSGSVFEQLSKHARDEIIRGIRGLNAVMATTAEYARDDVADKDERAIKKSIFEIQDLVSTVSTAVETPLLLDATVGGRSSVDLQDKAARLLDASDVDAAIQLREAILNDDPSSYSRELDRDKIHDSLRRSGTSRRFKLGTMDGQPVIMETYTYSTLTDANDEPQPQALQRIQKITGLLCHPKRKEFHILPCAGFFRDRRQKELGIVFRAPLSFAGDSKVLTLLQLYRLHRVVPLGHRMHLAWDLTTAVEHFHRVGWVHKSIRSDNIAFISVAAHSQTHASDMDSTSPLVDSFAVSNPLLFGFEYSRADDEATGLEEDHSVFNNLYRHPERWGQPAARFEKRHDVYSLGVMLLEIAIWKEASSILQSFLESKPLIASNAPKVLIRKCGKSLAHQVGIVFVQCIVTCLEFGDRTKAMSEYEAQRYFQQNVTEPMGRAVGRI